MPSSDPFVHYNKAFYNQVNRERFSEANIILVGDKVKRTIGGVVVMELTVTEITQNLIICGDYTFNRQTGGEVDTLLGWDGIKRTGSFIHKERVCDE